MTFSKPNRSDATLTKTRVKDVAPFSGMCVTCLEGCPGLCEVGKSAYRGREVIYPQPFGKVTAACDKDYPVDYSHINIHGTCVGAHGIEADSDKAIFPNVSTETVFGAGDAKIRLSVPIFTGAIGSTDIARKHWEAAAMGGAMAGIMVVCGENVCGMDPQLELDSNRKVKKSPEMERRVRAFKEFFDGEHGQMVVQLNVEDTRLGVAEYVREIGVDVIELKWGQGAKDIGGEVKLGTLDRARQLKSRGYVVVPDPDDPTVVKAFEAGAIKEFERHSRLGMVDEEAFYKEVERLRGLGFKYVTLKTGAYRPVDLARAIKWASKARLDLVTIDGAGGGTGMSPWRMMSEWGIPTLYLQAMAYDMAKRLEERGEWVPPLAIAGGLSLEDHVFKAIAMGAPYFKAVCMGRPTLTAAMVGDTIGEMLKSGNFHPQIKKFGTTIEEIFICAEEVKDKYGADILKKIPAGALGVYTFCKRLELGLQQLMAGARKFRLDLLSRDDLFALTKEAAEITGLPYVMDVDREEVDRILES